MTNEQPKKDDNRSNKRPHNEKRSSFKRQDSNRGGKTREGGYGRRENRDWKPKDSTKRSDRTQHGDRTERPDRGERRDRNDGGERHDRREFKRDGFKRDEFKRDGSKRDGQKREGFKRDGFKKDGFKKDGFKKDGPAREGRGGTRGGGRSDRGGAKREFTEAERLEHSLKPVREKHDDPQLDADVTADELHPAARNELKTLDKENAELVAKHLAMVARLIDEDPETAHQHAISAMRRAGRIPVTRETYAITSYTLGDFATALRELRTYRRLSGRNDQLALMIDSERGLGRPERALELGRETDISKLRAEDRVQVAIALSGARLDLGQPLQALYELEIKELDKNRAFPWSPELFAVYSVVLEDLGRFEEAKEWKKRAIVAEKAIFEATYDETRESQLIVEEELDFKESPSSESTEASVDETEREEIV